MAERNLIRLAEHIIPLSFLILLILFNLMPTQSAEMLVNSLENWQHFFSLYENIMPFYEKSVQSGNVRFAQKVLLILIATEFFVLVMIPAHALIIFYIAYVLNVPEISIPPEFRNNKIIVFMHWYQYNLYINLFVAFFGSLSIYLFVFSSLSIVETTSPYFDNDEFELARESLFIFIVYFILISSMSTLLKKLRLLDSRL